VALFATRFYNKAMNQPPDSSTARMLQNLAEQSRNTTGLAEQVIARLLDGRVTPDQQHRNWFAPITIADDVDNPD
jgi:hypothetical protein